LPGTTDDVTDTVEGDAVNCSCVGDPLVLETRERWGRRLPLTGVLAEVGVVMDPPTAATGAGLPDMVTTLGMETEERTLKEDEREKEEEEEVW